MGVVDGSALGVLQIDRGQARAVCECTVQRGEVGGQLHGVQLIVNDTALIHEGLAGERSKVRGTGQVEFFQGAVAKYVVCNFFQSCIAAGHSYGAQLLAIVECVFINLFTTLGNFKRCDCRVLERTLTNLFNIVVEHQRGQLGTTVECILTYSIGISIVCVISQFATILKCQGRNLRIAIECTVSFTTVPTIYDFLNVVLVQSSTVLFSEVGGNNEIDVTASGQSNQTVTVESGNLHGNSTNRITYGVARNCGNLIGYKPVLFFAIDFNSHRGTDVNACARILAGCLSQCN